MTAIRTDDTRIEQSGELLSPIQLMRELRASDAVHAHVAHARSAIHDVLRGADDRMFIVVGPCSIHDPAAALDYAKKLKPLADELAHDLIGRKHTSELQL